MLERAVRVALALIVELGVKAAMVAEDQAVPLRSSPLEIISQ